MEDWGDFTLNITVMPPEPAVDRASDLAAGADDELLPTQPFRKPTLDQLKPKATPPKPLLQPLQQRESQPLPLRTGTLHSVAGLPLPRMEQPRPMPVTPPPRATLDSLRAATPASQPIRTAPGSQPIRTTPGSQPIRTATGTTPRPSSRITPAFGTRLLTPPSGSRPLPSSPSKRGKRGDHPGAARRSRWAKDLLQRFNFYDCA
jgi:hypothetical protein